MDHRVYVGQWVFWPQHMAARNIHNGNPVFFRQRVDGSWVASGVNIPAEWMMRELCEWFGKWISGQVADPAPKGSELT